MRLGEKWCKPQQQYKLDEKVVLQQIFHIPSPLAQRIYE
jgi:hypothetical protein